MHIREREFQPFAFRINQEALPELVEDYTFTQERKPTTEVITDAQHVKALEIAFENGPIVGYGLLIKSLRQGYAEIGFKRGRNICIELNKYLMGRGVIIKKDKAYVYQPEALNSKDGSSSEEV